MLFVVIKNITDESCCVCEEILEGSLIERKNKQDHAFPVR